MSEKPEYCDYPVSDCLLGEELDRLRNKLTKAIYYLKFYAPCTYVTFSGTATMYQKHDDENCLKCKALSEIGGSE